MGMEGDDTNLTFANVVVDQKSLDVGEFREVDGAEVVKREEE